MFPILRDWDERLWPNEAQLADRVERRIESVQIRDLSLSLRSPEVDPVSCTVVAFAVDCLLVRQPGVAGKLP